MVFALPNQTHRGDFVALHKSFDAARLVSFFGARLGGLVDFEGFDVGVLQHDFCGPVKKARSEKS
jgi:hypothetical protein